MVFPTRNVPEEDPNRAGPEGTAGTSAAALAEPEAKMDAEANMEMAVQAESDATNANEMAYASPPTDVGAPTGSGSLAGARSTMDSGTRADAGPSVDTVPSQRWNQIQAGFVDDPRGSVTQAAGMVDEAIEAFVSAARERQAWLASSWQGQDAGTEKLRTVLQDYRAFWSSMTEIPQPA
jgi:hypothetical protein